MAVSGVNIYCALPVLVFIYAMYGVWHYLKVVEINNCDMTYMFEYPEYLKIPLNYYSAAKFPRYNLFVYGEGKYADELSAEKYSGTPVLFIPGNAGSHRQVRSLASVSYRISQSRQTSVKFDFFTIDFNEEISALYGGTLNEQTEFVQECIWHIQTLYPTKKKVVLIGHSMGGVVAKAVFSLSSFDPSNVSLILTLASPHRRPVLALDSAIVNFYEKIQMAWRYRLKPELRNIPVITIGGGQRDALVRSDLISNDFEHSSPLDIHVLTPAIPGVWLSTDHLAIMWCKQLVLTICRSLFDFSSLLTNQAVDLQTVKSIMHFHYYSRWTGNQWPTTWFLPVRSFPSSGQWIEQDMGAWRFSRTKVLSSVYILVPLSQNRNVVVVASGLVKGDWIFGCTKLSDAGTKTCLEAENLSKEAEIIPSRKQGVERRIAHFKSQELLNKGHVYLLVYIAPVDAQVEILGETYVETERVKHYKLPSLLDRIFSINSHRLFTISLVDQIVYYNITVPRSAGVFEAVEFQLETRLCRAGSVVGQGIVKMYIPWSGEQSFYPIRTSLGGLTTIPVLSHSLPPSDMSPDVNLLFILDPECSIVLTAKSSFFLATSQFMKFYGSYILGYTVAFLLILLSDQLRTFSQQGTSSSVARMFVQYPSFLTLVVFPSVTHHFIKILGISAIPFPDPLDLSSSFFTSLLLRSLLYLVSGGLVICTYVLLQLTLRWISSAWIYIMHRSILKTTQVPLEHISRNRVQVSKGMLVCSAILAAISVGCSSSLATLLILVFYFIKLASMFTRCRLEEERRGSNSATCCWYFHMVLFLLWTSTLLLVSPGLVMWVKSLKFSLKLSSDVYTIPCTLMIVCSGLLWQLPTPIISRYKYEMAALFIQASATLITLYGISSFYRLLYFIMSIFVGMCVQQTLAYFHGPAYFKCD